MTTQQREQDELDDFLQALRHALCCETCVNCPDPERARRLVHQRELSLLAEVEKRTGQWREKAYYTKNPVLWKPIAPESNAEHYDAGFNQAIELQRQTLQAMREDRL